MFRLLIGFPVFSAVALERNRRAARRGQCAAPVGATGVICPANRRSVETLAGVPASRRNGFALIGALLALLPALTGATLYVSPTGSQVAPYSTLANAARDIQTAVNSAVAGDDVVVASGTYTLTAQIQITTGITVRSSGGAAVTTVDGNNAVRCFSISHASAVVDGFTVTRGRDANCGGGVVFGDLYNASAGGLVRNCIIKDNDGGQYGGGAWINGNGTLRNCLIINNRATINYGGGVAFWKGGLVENCTISGNQAFRGGGIHAVSDTGGTTATIRNSIIYGNGAALEYPDANVSWSYGGGTYTNNCASPSSSSAPLPGAGNITGNPLFVNPPAGNFRLQAGSPCLDTGGSLGWTASAVDLDGLARVSNGTVDMGAYEFAAAVTLAAIAVTPANPALTIGATQQFTATGTFSDNSTRAMTSGGNTWTSGAAIPSASYGLGATFVGGKLYAISGFATTRVAAYDPVANTWANVASLPALLQSFGTAVLDGKIYVVGGDTGGSGDRATLYRYDPSGNSWTTLAAMPLGARYGVSATVLNGKIYAIGGYTMGTSTYLDRVEVYDPAANTWSTGTPLPAARHQPLCGAINGKIYVAGGSNATAGLTSAVVFDPVANTWTTVASMPVSQNGIAAVVDGKLFSLDGGGGTEKLVQAYDPVANTWATLAPLPTGRHALGVAVDESNRKIYAVGGWNGAYVSALDIFTPPGDVTWLSATPAVATISATGLATGVATGATTITATAGAISGSTVLTIGPPPQEMFVSNGGGASISKVASGGTPVTTFATGISGPLGMALDAAGNLFVSANGDNTLKKVTPAGVVSTFGPSVFQPVGMAFDAAGNLYVASNGAGKVVKVTPAGSGSDFVTGLANPVAVVLDATGNLYVANYSGNSISKVTPAGAATAFVSSGIAHPYGLAIDAAGNLYVSNYDSGVISKVTPAGVVSTYASGFTQPMGLAFDGAGNLWVANYGSGAISRVAPGGGITSYATGFASPGGIALVPTPVAPAIVTPPAAQTVVAGAAASFNVVANGIPAPTYQWRKGGVNISGATNASYTIATTAVGDAGSYDVVVANTAGSVTSAAATLTVNVLPAITTQPVALTVTTGGSATFTVTATGTPAPTYQWRKNGAAISGATNASLAIAVALLGDAGSYDVIITNAAGNVTSSAVTLNVSLPATITLSGTPAVYMAVDPVRHFLYVGESTGANPKYLDVINTQTNALTGTYSYSGSGWSSMVATSGTNVFWADQGGSAVRVLAVNASGLPSLSRSDPLTLATGVAALSTTYAANLQGTGDVMKIVRISDGVVLSTTSVGTPAGVVLADPNTNLYYANAGSVYKVLNTSGAILRTLPTGTVLTIDSAPAHNFVYFVPSTNSHQLQQLTGSDNTATGRAYDFGVGATVSYAAVDAATGNVWASLGGQNKVAVLDANLNLLQQFTVTNPEAIAFADGVAYVHVSNTTTLQLIAGTLSGSAPVITAQPVAQTVAVGASVSFTVVATGNPAPTFQWRKGAANLSGATSATFTLASAVVGDAGSYDVVVTNTGGSVTSSAAALTVNVPPAITTQPVAQTVVAGAGATFTVVATGAPAPTYQWRKGGANISGATNASYSIASTVAGDAASYDVVVTNAAGNVTSNTATLTVNVPPAITTQPVAQTVLAGAGATFTVVATGAPAPTYQWRKGGANISGATNATYSIASVVAGDAGNFDVVVTNAAGSVTSSAVALTVNAPPAITAQPVAQSGFVGSSVTMCVTASGVPAPTFQWRKGGANISGATSSCYTIPNVQLADAGSYDCTITNSAGSVNSAAAALTVSASSGPTITTQPQPSAVLAGATVTFTVGAEGTPAPAYQWRKNGAAIAGATSNTLTLANVQMADGGNYDVVVSNVSGTVVSAIVGLSVNATGLTVAAWGDDGVRQTSAPAAMGGFKAIAVGPNHTLAVRVDGTVAAWGSADEGRTTIPADLNGVVAVAAGNRHSLALRSDGTVVGWGSNMNWQSSVPGGLTGVTAIAAGAEHSVALKSDRTVVAWGSNAGGEINVPAGLGAVVAVAAGGSHNLALKSNGTVIGWGVNSRGQLTIPAGLSGVVAVAAGQEHSLALKSDGTVIGWGRNDSGEITVPNGLTGVVAIASGAGSNHSVALKSDGTVVAWGDGVSGAVTVPVGLTGVVAIAASGGRSVALYQGLIPPLRAVSNVTTSYVVSVNSSAAWTVTNDLGWLSITPTSGNGSGLVTVTVQANNRVLPRTGSFAVAGRTAVVYQAGVGAGNETLAVWGDDAARQTSAASGIVAMKAIAAGPGHTLAVRADGTVAAWGDSADGRTTVPANLNGVVAVAGGNRHSLALKSDGTVVGWGSNMNWQALVPGGLTGVVGIAAGAEHSLALKSDGTVVAWGSNANGEVNVPVGLGAVVAVAAGTSHSLALKSDGTVIGWGVNNRGQLTIPEGLSRVVAVAAGGEHSLALKSDGTVVGWGRNDNGEISVPPGLTGVVAIATGPGSFYSLALKSDGTVVAWGSNAGGATTVPAGLTGVVAIAAGGAHSVALYQGLIPALQKVGPAATSYALSVGANSPWTVSNNSSWLSVTPTSGSGNGTVTVTVSANGLAIPRIGTFTVAGRVAVVSQAGGTGNQTIEAWGDDGAGQTSAPSGWDGMKAIAAGPGHTLAVKLDGTVVAWGDGGEGRTAIPANLSGVVAVAAGNRHSLALKSDGTVVGWGSNMNWQSLVPGGLTGVVGIAAGAEHSLALKSDGTVVAWGSNANGEVNVPAGLGGVVAVAAGASHSLALKSDGTVIGWGVNNRGQLTIPDGLTGVVAVAAGQEHSLALKSDGTVVGWGRNDNGEISVPPGLAGVVAIATGPGSFYSLALKSDGTVVAWGSATAGATTPPGYMVGAVAIAAAGNHSLALTADNARSIPVITTQPGNITLATGQTATFRVMAAGAPAHTYQWRKNGTAIAGATSPILSLANVQSVDAGLYAVAVTNTLGTTISNAATLALTGTLDISTQPQSQTVVAGASVTFTVVAAGNPAPTFQWRKAGANLAGATNAGYTIASAQPGDAGSYDVVVANGANSLTSSPATLTVNVPPAITTQPVAQTVTVGASATFTVAATGTPAPTYQWRKGGTAIASATNATLTLTNVQSVDAGNYDVVVTSAAGNVTSSAVALTVNVPGPVTIYVSPDGTQVAPYNSPASATRSIQTAVDLAATGDVVMVANGTYTLTAQIQITKGITLRSANGAEFAIIDGNNAVRCFSISHAGAIVEGFTITRGRDANFGGGVSFGDLYSASAGGLIRNCIITNNNGGQYGGGVWINGNGTVRNCLIVNNQASINFGGGVALWKGGLVENCTISGNQAYRGGGLHTVSDSGGATATIRNTIIYGNGAALEYADVNVSWSYGGGTYANNCASTNSSSAPLPGTGNITTNPLFTNPPAGNFRLQAGSPAIDAGGNLGWTATGVDLDGQPRTSNGAVDMGAYEYVPAGPPTITAQPQLQTVNVGQTVSFAVSAVGAVPLSYQWRKGGANLTGATNAAYSIAAAQLADAGSYSVVVANGLGAVTSNAVALTVNPLALASIAVMPANLTLGVGATQQFTATGTFTDSSSRPLTAGGNTWTSGPSLAQASYGLGAAFVGGKLYAISGFATTRVAAYDPVANSWTNVASLPQLLQYYGTAVLEGKIYVVGGDTGGGGDRATLYRFDPAANAWTSLAAMPLGSRYGVAAAVLNGKIYAIGGYNIATATYLDRVEIYDPATNTWTTGTPLPAPRHWPLCGTVNGKIYVAGGSNATGGLTSAVAYDPATNAWNSGAAMPVGQSGQAAVIDGKLFAIGGGGAPEKLVQSYDPVTNTWATLAQLPTGRHDLGVAADEANRRIYAVGGYGGGYVSALDIFTPPGEVTWSSGTPATATITAGGFVTGVANGTSTITATVGGVSGNTLLTVATTTAGAPAFSTQPQSQAVTAGAGVTFTAVASGTPAPTYQWRKGGANLTGATNASYVIASAQSADAGNYDVVATNSAGSVTSNAATLTVNVPPAITTQPTSQTVNAGANVTFTVVATGTPAPTYQWLKGGASLAGATGSTMTLNGAQPGDAGSYSVVVANSAGSVISNTVTLTITAIAPTITTQPSSQSANVGASVTLTVAVGGTAPFSYQWLKNGATLAGATSSSLTFASAQVGDSATYTVVVANAAGSAISNTATLTVNPTAVAPAITAQPQSLAVSAGQTAVFSVTATGTPAPTYQWLKNGASLAGATAATLTLGNVQSADAATFTVVVSNTAGSAISNAATLTVNVPPAITTQPVAANASVGASVTFTVVATGTSPLNYQWRRSGANLAGATGASLTIANVRAGDAGSYDVVVANAAGSVTSTAVALMVNRPAGSVAAWGAGANNSGIDPDYGQSIVPAGLSAVTTVVAAGSYHTMALKNDGTVAAWGNNGNGQSTVPAGLGVVTAIAAGGYHSLALKSDGTVAAWGSNFYGQATVPAGLSGVVAIAAGNSHSLAVKSDGTVVAWGWNSYGQATVPAGLSGVIAIAGGYGHSVALKSNGTVVAWGDNSYGESAVPAGLTGVIAIAAGYSHSLALKSDGTVAAWGSNAYGETTVPAGLNGAVAISAGGGHSVALKSDGTAVTWGYNGNGQATVPAGLSGVLAIAAGYYHSVAVYTAAAPAITTQPSSVTVNAGQMATFSVTATGTAPLSYQWRKAGTNVTSATSSSYSIASAQASHAGSYDVVITNSAGSATSNVATLTVNAVLPAPVITSATTASATAGTAFTYAITASNSPTSFAAGGLPAGLTVNTTSGVISGTPTTAGTYPVSLTATNAGGMSPAVTLTLTVNPPSVAPAITTQPTNQAISVGQTATFSVVATGTPAPSYQWLKNGVSVSGGTSSTLTLTNVQTGDAGNYSVLVANAAGNVISNPATLTVSVPAVAPVITTQPASLTVNVGASASFTVAATGTPAPTYQWLKNGASLAGATDVTLTLNNVQIGDAANYSVVVANSAGSAISNAAILTVNVPSVAPAITTQPQSLAVNLGASATFSVTATGSPAPSFQWLKNGASIPGATSASLTLNSVAAGDAGNYSVVVANAAGSAISNAAALAINAPPAIVTQPAPQTINSGQLASFSVVATGAPVLTYQWRKAGVAISGATNSSYTIASAVTTDAGSYDVLVTNGAGSVASSAVMLTVNVPNAAPVITTQPVAQAVNAGQAAAFSVAATGTPAPTYQWRKGGVNIPGATNASYNIASAQTGDAGSYDVVVSNGVLPNATSQAATLAVNVPTSITAQPAGTTIGAGSTATVAVAATGTGPLTYQWFQGSAGDATNPIGGATSASYSTPALTVTTSYWVRVTGPGGTVDSTTATVTVVEFAPTVALLVDGPAHYLMTGGTVTLRVRVTYAGQTPSAIGATVNLPAGWSLASTGGPNVPQVAPVAGTTSVLEWGYSSFPANLAEFTFVLNTPAGQSGAKVLGGFVNYRPGNVNVTLPAMTLTGVTPLVITTQPQATQIDQGKSVTLSLAATGDPVPSYQWRKSSQNISGATYAYLTIPAATMADAGYYDVVVSNGVAADVISDQVLLRVIPTGTAATHVVVGGGYTQLTKVTISNTITYTGTATALGWQVLLPTGWSFDSDGGAAGEQKPAVGTTGLLEWAWTTIPPSPVTFTYTLNKPVNATGEYQVAAFAIVRQESMNWRFDLLAKSDPLRLRPVVPHTADRDTNFRINLTELTRVIELYNSRLGTTRTGRYKVQVGTEDGFAADPQATSNQVLTAYHSADSDRNGALSLTELTRVIELYNTRAGTVRTGSYHIVLPPADPTEDGFAPGP